MLTRYEITLKIKYVALPNLILRLSWFRMAKITAQFFTKNNQRIPFHQFLQDAKKSRGCSWKELDEICGVNRISSYVMAQTNGEPNRPPHDKFLQIIHALGYSENDFEFSTKIAGGHRLSKTEYKEQLRMLGERVLQMNQEYLERGENSQKLSVPIIKEVCGDYFYQKYAKGFSSKKKLYHDLIALDPKFSSIELQHQEQQRTSIRNLEAFEKDIIETSLLHYTEQSGQPSPKRLPFYTSQYVQDKLNAERKKKGLPPRTLVSVQWHIHRIWGNYRKPDTHKRGSPISSAGITDQILVEQIEEIVERQRKTPDTKLISNVLIEKDEDNRRRDLYRRYSDEGHTNLVVFLMEPDNYSEYISKDVSLFAIDFPVGEVDEVLRGKYEEKMALLKARQEELPDEADVIDFIDSWLRCDMIFIRNGGGFVVVEVKQHAVNRPNGFKNATKACQQLSAYCAVILDNILRHNIDNINATEYRPIKESVEGYLVAYEMDTSVKNHLNRAGSKRPVIIPKQIVDTYITELHSRRQIEQTLITPTWGNELSHLVKST